MTADHETAIRTGALAIGRVKAIEPSTYNNPEEIRIELQYVQAVDGQMVPLSGQEQSLRGQFTGQGRGRARYLHHGLRYEQSKDNGGLMLLNLF